jgi:hypothetical protein
LGDETLPWLTTDWILGQFGTRLAIARTRFAAFVEEAKAEGHSEAYYGGKDDSRVVGEEDFVNSIISPKTRSPRPPSLSAIVSYACQSTSMSEAELKAPGKNRTAAQTRALIGWLALKSKAASLTQVAARFHRDSSTLSHAVTGLDRKSRTTEGIASALKQHLAAL